MNKLKDILNAVKSALVKAWGKVSEWILNGLKYVGTGLSYAGKYTGLAYVKSFIARNFNKLKNKQKNAIYGYLFISPWLVGLMMFGVYPIYRSLRMAFAEDAHTVVVDTVPTYIIEGFGFTQFKQIFQEHPEIVEALIAFAKDILLVVPLVLVFALIIALMLNQDIKGRGIFRMIFFLPVILLSGNMLGYFGQYGLMDIPVLQSSDLIDNVSFYFTGQLGNIIGKVFEMIVLLLWLSGVQTLIFLAGLTKMDKSVYEAASIDGASVWESFWKITLPTLSPLLIVNIVYTTVIYLNLTSNEVIRLISQATTGVGMGRDFASALSWLVFLIGLAVIGIYTLAIRLGMKRYD